MLQVQTTSWTTAAAVLCSIAGLQYTLEAGRLWQLCVLPDNLTKNELVDKVVEDDPDNGSRGVSIGRGVPGLWLVSSSEG